MTTVEILRAAKARIDTPEKWWGGNGDRRNVRRGVRDCALLALADETDDNLAHPAITAITRVMQVHSAGCIPSFNDSHTHAEVMAAFDRAIELEEAREQEFTVTEELMVA